MVDVSIVKLQLGLNDDTSTLAQVMAWCRQATSHYLSQYWPTSMSPYGVTSPRNLSEVLIIDSNNIMKGVCNNHLTKSAFMSMNVRIYQNVEFRTIHISSRYQIPPSTADMAHEDSNSLIRHRQGNIYGIWQYKVLSLKRLIERIILRYAKLTHQLSFKNMNLKVDHYTRGKSFSSNDKKMAHLLLACRASFIVSLSMASWHD